MPEARGGRRHTKGLFDAYPRVRHFRAAFDSSVGHGGTLSSDLWCCAAGADAPNTRDAEHSSASDEKVGKVRAGRLGVAVPLAPSNFPPLPPNGVSCGATERHHGRGTDEVLNARGRSRGKGKKRRCAGRTAETSVRPWTVFVPKKRLSTCEPAPQATEWAAEKQTNAGSGFMALRLLLVPRRAPGGKARQQKHT